MTDLPSRLNRLMALAALALCFTTGLSAAAKYNLDPGCSYVAQKDSLHYEMIADAEGCIGLSTDAREFREFQLVPLLNRMPSPRISASTGIARS
jgi:hypothetical protein